MKQTLFIVILALGLSSMASAQQEKIGFFSSSQLVSFFPEAKTIQAEIEKISTEKQAIGTTLENELKSKLKKFEEEKASMATILQETRIEEIRNLETKIQTYYANARKEIDNKRQELLKPVFTKINDGIKQVAKKHKFTAIIDLDSGRQFLLYIDESRDILELMKTELGLE
ncbi:OmpH family outer membrane protein [Aureispira anguillae]|uniref:OmpH family outer membrane protein n=1 Tax=Aureispira anguillae TaxID=2864201 RepID=A0A915YHS6_9BACT|nr:OmpH family outer membrane protein [Aureispira anguillae]BDS13249.1 OmpH family outer membrane protein [Aureispira anguillae]